MAIFRCNKCSHLREVGNGYIGKSVKCPKCDNTATCHDTVAYLNALIKKYIEKTKELNLLHKKFTIDNSNKEIVENLSLVDIDIHNTNVLTQDVNFSPIVKWFRNKNIEVEINPDAVDTTGFFDEIAMRLGNNFKVLKYVTNQIKYVQNKGYKNVKIDISKKNNKEAQQIISFCKSLYDYSFVAKYFYQKKDKIIRLTLQTAPKIRDFFNGIWMEWFILMQLLKFFSKNKIAPSCSRSIKVNFSDNNSNELDIFFLTEQNVPVYIECKSGEFRHDINKYLSLRKKLNLERKQFILCIFGLDQEKAQGLSSMYDLTFVNENSLINHVKTII